MPNADGWAGAAAALPQAARRLRETEFWQALAAHWGWRRVIDAGCGAGFHVDLLASLGVEVWGFDRALPALSTAPRGRVVAADLLALPWAGRRADAAICLGNTFSLLPRRVDQRHVLDGLAAMLRPGGVLLLQGEDVGSATAQGPLVRSRRIDAHTAHVRIFQRQGRRVQILGGVVKVGAEAPLEQGWLLPTDAAVVKRLGRAAHLEPATLPVPTPGGGTTWWVALVRRD